MLAVICLAELKGTRLDQDLSDKQEKTQTSCSVLIVSRDVVSRPTVSPAAPIKIKEGVITGLIVHRLGKVPTWDAAGRN